MTLNNYLIKFEFFIVSGGQYHI